MPDTHTESKVLPAVVPPMSPPSYPLPADLDPLQPQTMTLPRVRRMPPPTRRPAFTPVGTNDPYPYHRRMNMPPTANALPGPITPWLILSRMTDDEVDNNLFQHAVRELILLGYPIPAVIAVRAPLVMAGIIAPSSFAPDKDGDISDINAMMSTHILSMVAMFTQGRHSGMSAGYAIGVLEKLLQYQSLVPLTNNPDEWVQHGGPDESGTDFWQNKRQSDCFSNDPNLRYYYKLDDRTWFGRTLMYRRWMPQNLRKWIHDRHIFWVNTKHKTQPDPLHPIPGTSTTSTPIVKRNPKHVRMR